MNYWMSPDNGVKIFDNSNNFVTVDSTVINCNSKFTLKGWFNIIASTTTIGNTSTEHVELTWYWCIKVKRWFNHTVVYG